ncbi:hypothetical protein LTR62_008442 [Meristemomyces frigidus]|uniref:Uncharacterized protein n=1 Tax=Meristemomyces frigidus TaxID=1508187 RepID=A0AAN7TU73_9PEZI|nr:hypothetical protein LTR62_008442 [Meristemomyces frigidus]
MLKSGAKAWRHSQQVFRYSLRRYATEPTPTPTTSRIARIESRLPRLLRHFTTPLRNAPVSHITAFLVLHELTAILPLFGLAAFFHYTNWLPPFISEGKWVTQGLEKFGRYARKKGWISEADEREAAGSSSSTSGRWWGRGEGGVRIVVEFATAYAVTKALLPLRLVVSVWATPWFARWTVLPVTAALRRVWQRQGASVATRASAAGTGAVSGGVLPKEAGLKTK